MNVLAVAIKTLLDADTGAGGVAALVGTDGDGLKQIYHAKASPKAVPPYVIFREPLDTPLYTYGPTVSGDHVFYAIQAFAADSPTASGTSMAGSLADRIRTLLLSPALTVSGKSVRYCAPLQIMNPTEEWDDINSRWIYGRGWLVEMWVADTVLQITTESEVILEADV